LAAEELGDYLRQCSKERRLSLRALSINAGLSPGTVHNIINRQYMPSIFSLNRLADYLSVKRQYLWHLSGLLEDMDYSEETSLSDPRLKFYFAQADKLPEAARDLVIVIIKAITDHFPPSKTPTETIPE